MTDTCTPTPENQKHQAFHWLARTKSNGKFEYTIAYWCTDPGVGHYYPCWMFAGDDVECKPDRAAANGWQYVQPVQVPPMLCGDNGRMVEG